VSEKWDFLPFDLEKLLKVTFGLILKGFFGVIVFSNLYFNPIFGETESDFSECVKSGSLAL